MRDDAGIGALVGIGMASLTGLVGVAFLARASGFDWVDPAFGAVAAAGILLTLMLAAAGVLVLGVMLTLAGAQKMEER